MSRPRPPRPTVRINMAMSADGKITSAARDYPELTSDFDRRSMDRLRAEADAILVGAGTIRADDPPMGVRDPGMRAYRERLGKTGDPRVIVVSGRLELSPELKLFARAKKGERLVVTTRSAPAEQLAKLSSVAEVWQLGEQHVDLSALLERLYAAGVRDLLAEGGAELNGALLEADLVDELNLTLAPSLLGGREAPTPFAGAGLRMAERRRLELLSVLEEGDELYLRYRVRREPARES